MLEVYIKYKDYNYYSIDLKDGEGVNLKTIYKDLNDITKIFSPYTQSFKIPATDKNKMLIGFLGNEKTLNYGFEFDAKIYISGFLSQSGILTFKDFDYDQNEQTEFTADFGSTISGLVERIGGDTIQDLFIQSDGSYDTALRIPWNLLTVKNYLQNLSNKVMSNGINLSFGVPFISNIRTWIYSDNTSTVDNIAFNKFRLNATENFIKLGEVRPAITYATILKQLIYKYNLNVICPILERPEITELFAFCNSESLVVASEKGYRLLNYENIVYSTYDFKNNNGSPPSSPLWQVTIDRFTGIIKIKRTVLTGINGGWQTGLDLNLIFNNLTSLDGNQTKIKVNLINASSNIVLNSQTIDNVNAYKFQVLDYYYYKNINDLRANKVTKDTILNSSGEIFLRFEVLPETLVSWSNIEFNTFARFYTSSKGVFGIVSRTHQNYESKSLNNTLSENLGGDKLNLITTLPKMKAIDFLKSFFKTFNISVIATGRDNNEMYWVTPSDFLLENKEYSKRLVDYTLFTDNKSFSKKNANKYNQYLFSHKKSKYYESLYGDGTYFGSLSYPTIAPKKPTKFEVLTDYSIIKQSNFSTFNNVRTCLAFEKEGATIQANGGNRYKPVFDEFTIFYLKYKDLGTQRVGVEFTEINNYELKTVLEANFVNYTNGKSLAFGAENNDTDSLYLNYYKVFIENLFNAYESTFNLNLPSNEIFLNFSNQNQGESNIPTGFRPQNDIIIAEQRYSLIDSAIDLTNGKTKLTLLNY
jgi:hypothetical protein